MDTNARARAQQTRIQAQQRLQHHVRTHPLHSFVRGTRGTWASGRLQCARIDWHRLCTFNARRSCSSSAYAAKRLRSSTGDLRGFAYGTAHRTEPARTALKKIAHMRPHHKLSDPQCAMPIKRYTLRCAVRRQPPCGRSVSGCSRACSHNAIAAMGDKRVSDRS